MNVVRYDVLELVHRTSTHAMLDIARCCNILIQHRRLRHLSNCIDCTTTASIFNDTILRATANDDADNNRIATTTTSIATAAANVEICDDGDDDDDGTECRNFATFGKRGTMCFICFGESYGFMNSETDFVQIEIGDVVMMMVVAMMTNEHLDIAWRTRE